MTDEEDLEYSGDGDRGLSRDERTGHQAHGREQDGDTMPHDQMMEHDQMIEHDQMMEHDSETHGDPMMPTTLMLTGSRD